MQVSVVLTIIGPDRPGLVGSLSQAVADSGGNWLQSRMAHLAGQFAGILHVQAPPDRVDALLESLKALEAKGLTITAQRSDVAEAGASQRLRVMELVGCDRPGIVREISRALAARNINVEQLETQVLSAPMSGEPLFKATARLHVPADVSDDDLGAELERIGDQLALDVTLNAE